MRQLQLASKPGRVIGGKATAFDLHAHRLAASYNSPTPRRRIGRLAGRHYVIAPVVQFLNHGQVAEFSISNSLQCELARTLLWYHAVGHVQIWPSFDNHAHRQRRSAAGVPRRGGRTDLSTHDPRIVRGVSQTSLPRFDYLSLRNFL